MTYLSIVAASRNDDHGGDPLIRTQIFINNLAKQCDKYKLDAELILVDWNPVSDRPGLSAVLSLPEKTSYLDAKVVTVPTFLHNRLKYSENLNLFQMIAKNVGIRRANGDYILATNIDIIFSDELINFISKKNLNTKNVYRVDRFDIRSGLAINMSLDEALKYAWSNIIRINTRFATSDLKSHMYSPQESLQHFRPDSAFIDKLPKELTLIQEQDTWKIRPENKADISKVFCNGCGDFTLMSKQGWEHIRGYPEFESFSMNIDSMGLLAAHYAGFTEISLLPPCACFHIEHNLGSGWTPEGANLLFKKLEKKQTLSPEWNVLTPLVSKMQNSKKTLHFNNTTWGLEGFDLPILALGERIKICGELLSRLKHFSTSKSIGALLPVYDLDRLNFWRAKEKLENLLNETEQVQLFVPDASGAYTEEKSYIQYIKKYKMCNVIFKIDHLDPCAILRFDPSETNGEILIKSIDIQDHSDQKYNLLTNKSKQNGLSVSGSAIQIKSYTPPKIKSQSSKIKKYLPTFLKTGIKRTKKFMPLALKRSVSKFRKKVRTALVSQNKNGIMIKSIGIDPQIIFPPLDENISFPLYVKIEMIRKNNI